MVDVLRDLYSRPKIVITKNSWRISRIFLALKGIMSKLFIFSTLTIYHAFNPISVRKLYDNRTIYFFSEALSLGFSSSFSMIKSGMSKHPFLAFLEFNSSANSHNAALRFE